MRSTSFLITLICLVPTLLVFAGWVVPLSEAGQENWAHIRETVLGEYLFGSLGLMILVALFAGVIGTGTAFLVSRYDFPLRGLATWLLILPFAMPSYILAMSYGNLLDYAGPIQSGLRALFPLERGYNFPQIRSLPGAAIILALSTFPYVYLVGRAAFSAQSAEWSKLADVYGRNKRFTMLRVSLGAARPFLAVGVALCVMEAAADIGVTQLFGVPTLATGLYRLWYFGDDPMVSARLASLLVMIAGVLLLTERLSRRRARFTAMGESNPIPRQRLAGWKKWAACFAVGLPIFLGFAFPLLATIRLALFNTRFIRLENVLSATWDSFLLCVLGAVITICAAFIVNLSERRAKGRRFEWLAALGYAVPGIVIALSLLIVQYALRESFGWRLVITGSIFGMLLAFMIRFFAPAYQNLHSGFARISGDVDMMARGFGKGRFAMLKDVYLPLLRTPVFHAFLLVAIDILKELPASLILRPFDVKTLAIAVFEFAGDDRPAEAAPYALILIAFASMGVYFLAKLQESSK